MGFIICCKCIHGHYLQSPILGLRLRQPCYKDLTPATHAKKWNNKKHKRNRSSRSEVNEVPAAKPTLHYLSLWIRDCYVTSRGKIRPSSLGLNWPPNGPVERSSYSEKKHDTLSTCVLAIRHLSFLEPFQANVRTTLLPENSATGDGHTFATLTLRQTLVLQRTLSHWRCTPLFLSLPWHPRVITLRATAYRKRTRMRTRTSTKRKNVHSSLEGQAVEVLH